MFSFRSKRFSIRWPFWLLIAAWFCANSPQAATYKAIVWLGDARHFSHQQRLTLELATVLGGNPVQHEQRVTKAGDEKSSRPVIPAEATLKKIELALTLSSETLPVPSRAGAQLRVKVALPASPWREPPTEPPRAA